MIYKLFMLLKTDFIFNDILIICCVFVIAISGIIINYKKKATTKNINLVQDKNTLLLFKILIPSSLIVCISIYFLKPMLFIYNSAIFFNFGFFLVLFGLLLRWFSVNYLGRYFTVNVTILNNHDLITTGIYKYIRHPSYTGLILYYVGLGLLMSNFICLFILSVSALIVVLARIKVEEQVLNNHFGKKYKDYQKRSFKLMPFVF